MYTCAFTSMPLDSGHASTFYELRRHQLDDRSGTHTTLEKRPLDTLYKRVLAEAHRPLSRYLTTATSPYICEGRVWADCFMSSWWGVRRLRFLNELCEDCEERRCMRCHKGSEPCAKTHLFHEVQRLKHNGQDRRT